MHNDLKQLVAVSLLQSTNENTVFKQLQGTGETKPVKLFTSNSVTNMTTVLYTIPLLRPLHPLPAACCQTTSHTLAEVVYSSTAHAQHLVADLLLHYIHPQQNTSKPPSPACLSLQQIKCELILPVTGESLWQHNRY